MYCLGYNAEKRVFKSKDVGSIWVCGIRNVNVLYYRYKYGNIVKNWYDLKGQGHSRVRQGVKGQLGDLAGWKYWLN